MTPKQGIVNVFRNATNEKDFKVKATIFRQLAVHKSLMTHEELYPGLWTITQVSTGYAVCCYIESRKVALQVAKELEAIDWSGIRSNRSKKAIAKIAPLRKEILARYGL